MIQDFNAALRLFKWLFKLAPTCYCFTDEPNHAQSTPVQSVTQCQSEVSPTPDLHEHLRPQRWYYSGNMPCPASLV